jgi:hypothetical protein
MLHKAKCIQKPCHRIVQTRIHITDPKKLKVVIKKRNLIRVFGGL